MAGMTINFKRAGVVAFTDPYFKTGLSILLNKAKGARLKISSATSYNDIMQILKARGTEDKLIIAVTKGKSPARSTPRYFPKAQIKEYPSNKAAAKAVADGAAHIMVHDEIFLKVWAYENKNIAMYKLLVFPKPFKADNYGFAIKKGNQEFLNMLNVFIGELYVEDYIKLLWITIFHLR
jgi:polar amino acid transport system substrate-binding protein